ncbi:MAG: hypothetical protein ACPKPY_11275 [Nitrososphaeraceae archaeon]
MSKTKIGVFGVLLFGVMMLLIPATSIASAAEYDRYYQEKDRYSNDYEYDNDRYYDDYRQTSYDKQYKKVDKKESDRPVIIVDNKIPIPHHEKKEKKMKEPPMVLVTKEVLFCDTIASGDGLFCTTNDGGVLPGPNSDRYVTQCSSESCEGIDDSSFEIKVENANIFEGDEDGTKLIFNGERFTVTEENSNAVETALVGLDFGASLELELICQESGFDSSYVYGMSGDGFILVASCVQFEGDCSGIVQNDQLKECTVKNYVVSTEFGL